MRCPRCHTGVMREEKYVEGREWHCWCGHVLYDSEPLDKPELQKVRGRKLIYEPKVQGVQL